MQFNTALIVDDIQAHRDSAARILGHCGWNTYTAPDGARGAVLAQEILTHGPIQQVVILTDLRMPWSAFPADPLAGTHLALYLRTHMDNNLLPRVPILAFTALPDAETLLMARAFGCDAILEKPATFDLPTRIVDALANSSEASLPPEQQAIIATLRAQLVARIPTLATIPATLSSADMNAALLAFRRRGPVGLGASRLAHVLAPTVPGDLLRGEWVAEYLRSQLDRLARQGDPAIHLLQAELGVAREGTHISHCYSKSTYYRQRAVAVNALLECISALS